LRAIQRDATETEIRETMRNSQWQPAHGGRWCAQKKFTFNNVSPVNQQFYHNKIVEPVFTEETTEIVVITVKVYYTL
jgi:hypothetical protein